MVRVVINYDLVAIPQPIIDEAVIIGCHGKVESTETKPLRSAARQPPYMARPDSATEVTVLPWMIEMIVRVVSSRVVSNPSVISMDVRRIWMALHVAIITGLRRWSFLPFLHWRAMSLRLLSSLRLLFSSLMLRGRRRPVRGDMATA